jgi:aspartate racemase
MGRVLGILGGMGPLATIDFMREIVEATPARRDQDHLPIVVCDIPQIPDRTRAIVGRGASPLRRLRRGLAMLEAAGCSYVAIACNTAHHWYAQLSATSHVPILHIADAACDALARGGLKQGASVTVLGTEGTLVSGFYQERLAKHGFRYLELPRADLDRRVEPGIRHVKAGRIAAARKLFLHSLANLRRLGADAAILGCTEIPVALRTVRMPAGIVVLDSNRALAEACVRYGRGGRIGRIGARPK